MIHNEIVLAVKSNGNKVIGKDKEVEVKYLLFFKNGEVGTILTKEVLFHNVYICDFDYIYTITLKDGKPYFGEQLGSVYHKRADITISIYNQDIKKEARLIPCREGYLVYKYMELNFLK